MVAAVVVVVVVVDADADAGCSSLLALVRALFARCYRDNNKNKRTTKKNRAKKTAAAAAAALDTTREFLVRNRESDTTHTRTYLDTRKEFQIPWPVIGVLTTDVIFSHDVCSDQPQE